MESGPPTPDEQRPATGLAAVALQFSGIVARAGAASGDIGLYRDFLDFNETWSQALGKTKPPDDQTPTDS